MHFYVQKEIKEGKKERKGFDANDNTMILRVRMIWRS